MDTISLTAAGVDILADHPSNPNYPRGPIDPIRGPLTLHTFVSPDCSFRMMERFLDAAQESILIYIYNASSRDLLGLIEAARDRQVAIEIMYDATDTRDDEVARLQALGVTLHVAPSTGSRRAFTVCHQKYIVIDGRIVIVESANWATTSIPNPGTGTWKKGNREWFVAIESEPAAQQFTALFELDRDWEPPAGPLAEAPAIAPHAVEVLAPLAAAQPPQIFGPETFTLDENAAILPLLSPQNYFAEIKRAIEGATKSVWIEQQYIKSTGGTHVKPLLELLAAKVDEVADFDLRIIASAVYPESWEDTIASLEELGLVEFLRALNPRIFTHCHNKGVIVDGRIVVVSSTNWSNNSIAAARETGFLIDDEDVAESYARVFRVDWDTAIPWDQVLNELAAAQPQTIAPEETIHPADLA